MRSAPYFERLGEAYAVVGGIPDRQVTLDIERVRVPPDTSTIGVDDGHYRAPVPRDELVLTPDMWLSLHPAYVDIIELLVERWEPYGVEAFWRIEGRITSRFEIAMAHLFNLGYEPAEDLFGMRSDDEMDDRSDKQVFLDRLQMFLREHGQEITVGTGHVAEHEMLEHGIAVAEARAGEPAHDRRAEPEESGASPPTVRTGFGVLAAESEAAGPETFDTEASASAVSPIVHEQSIEQDKRDDA